MAACLRILAIAITRMELDEVMRETLAGMLPAAMAIGLDGSKGFLKS